MTTCGVCSFELEQRSSFCPQCGARLDAEELSPELLSTQRGLPLPNLIKPSVIRTDDLAKTQRLPELPETNESLRSELEPENSGLATLIAVPAVLDDFDEGPSPPAPNATEFETPLMESKPAGVRQDDSLSDPEWSQGTGVSDEPVMRQMGQREGVPAHGLGGSQSPLQRLGIALVFIGATICSMVYIETETQLSFGETSLSNVDGLLRLSVPVTTQGPVDITYPGGRKSIDGQDHLSFGFDGAQLKLGHQPIRLDAFDDDEEIPVKADLAILYRLRVVSFSERTLEMQLDLAPDVSVQVERGQLRSIDKQTFRWILELTDEDMKQRTIGPSLTLKTKYAGTHTLQETIDIPALYVPVSILSPTPGFIHTNKRIAILGNTLPDALIEYGSDKTVRASKKGEFRFEIDSDSTRGDVVLSISSEGLRTARVNVSYTALTGADRRASLKRLQATFNRLKQGATRVDGPIVLKETLQKNTVSFSGLLIARHRTGNDSQALIVNPCSGKKRCPVWVDYDGLDFSKLGRKVSLVGRILGTRTYAALDGQSRRVPRVLAEVVVP
ncbi:MAG: hypothetical protein VYA30_16200 [Myxococcota bacterium]|nr:hypothetical protein [Myxococcota bacterium]